MYAKGKSFYIRDESLTFSSISLNIEDCQTIIEMWK